MKLDLRSTCIKFYVRLHTHFETILILTDCSFASFSLTSLTSFAINLFVCFSFAIFLVGRFVILKFSSLHLRDSRIRLIGGPLFCQKNGIFLFSYSKKYCYVSNIALFLLLIKLPLSVWGCHPCSFCNVIEIFSL